MRATENAVEALARDSSGTILALDEMGHADGQVIGRLLYSLAGDVGKSACGPTVRCVDPTRGRLLRC
jgi:hypothetical protein